MTSTTREFIVQHYPSAGSSLRAIDFDEAIVGVGHRRSTPTVVYSLRALRAMDIPYPDIISAFTGVSGIQPLLLYSGGKKTWYTARQYALPAYEGMNFSCVGVCLKLFEPVCLAYSKNLLLKEMQISTRDSTEAQQSVAQRLELLYRTNMGENTPCIIEPLLHDEKDNSTNHRP